MILKDWTDQELGRPGLMSNRFPATKLLRLWESLRKRFIPSRFANWDSTTLSRSVHRPGEQEGSERIVNTCLLALQHIWRETQSQPANGCFPKQPLAAVHLLCKGCPLPCRLSQGSDRGSFPGDCCLAQWSAQWKTEGSLNQTQEPQESKTYSKHLRVVNRHPRSPLRTL